MMARKLYFGGKGCCGIILPTHTAEVLYLDDIESLLTSERRAETPINVSSCTLVHFYSLSHWFGSRFAHFISGYAQERGLGRRGSYTSQRMPCWQLEIGYGKVFTPWELAQATDQVLFISWELWVEDSTVYTSGAHRLLNRESVLWSTEFWKHRLDNLTPFST